MNLRKIALGTFTGLAIAGNVYGQNLPSYVEFGGYNIEPRALLTIGDINSILDIINSDSITSYNLSNSQLLELMDDSLGKKDKIITEPEAITVESRIIKSSPPEKRDAIKKMLEKKFSLLLPILSKK